MHKHNNEGDGAPNDRNMHRNFIHRGYRLISPMPSYSTHLLTTTLAPLRDWENLFNSIYL